MHDFQFPLINFYKNNKTKLPIILRNPPNSHIYQPVLPGLSVGVATN